MWTGTTLLDTRAGPQAALGCAAGDTGAATDPAAYSPVGRSRQTARTATPARFRVRVCGAGAVSGPAAAGTFGIGRHAEQDGTMHLHTPRPTKKPRGAAAP